MAPRWRPPRSSQKHPWSDLNDVTITSTGFHNGRQRRLPSRGDEESYEPQRYRNNLTALSQAHNLYVVAYANQLQVWEPNFPNQSLDQEPAMIINLPARRPGVVGPMPTSPGRFIPHTVNNIVVSDLGNSEIVVVACDDGDVLAYYTQRIQNEIEERQGPESGPIVVPIGDKLGPFLHANVDQSAWGLAVHKEARMIAVSANTSHVSVFAFALADSTALSSGSSDDSGSLGELSSILEQDGSGDWRDHSGPIVSRKHNLRITLDQHSTNVPCVEFCNTGEDPIGKYLLSTDIHGETVLHDVHKQRLIRSFRSSSNATQGWGLHWIDKRAFRPTQDPTVALKFCLFWSNRRDCTLDTGLTRILVPDTGRWDPPEENRGELVADHDHAGEDDFPVDDDDEVEADDPASDSNSDSSVVGEPSVEDPGNEHSDLSENAAEHTHPYRDGVRLMLVSTRPNRDSSVAVTLDGQGWCKDVTNTVPWPFTTYFSQMCRGEADSEEDGISEQFARRVAALSEPRGDTNVGGIHLSAQVDLRDGPGVFRSLWVEYFRLRDDKYLEEMIDLEESNSQINSATAKTQPRANAPTSPFLLLTAKSANLFQSVNCFRIGHSGLPNPTINLSDPLLQELTPWWHEQVNHLDRMNMSLQIPELGVIVAGSAKGRVMVCSLWELTPNPFYGPEAEHLRRNSRYKYKRGTSIPRGNTNTAIRTMRLDALLPLHSQEEKNQRPKTHLVGIAASPVQGYLRSQRSSSNTSPASPSPHHSTFDFDDGAGQKREGPAPRDPRYDGHHGLWRLMLYYRDETVLSYEISRKRGGGIGACERDGGAPRPVPTAILEKTLTNQSVGWGREAVR
ncbi:MAG: hypothetical protein M1831_005528 [Alyxoria varia]|nr:MAG: hypothetical protein M1831_005528 [Alyxoria varia]